MPDKAHNEMSWVSALSQRIHGAEALDEALASLDSGLSAEPDLVLFFVTPHHLPSFRALSRRLRQRYSTACLLGCTARGVIGGQREAERREALSLTAAILPDVRVRPVHLTPEMRANEAWASQLAPAEDAPHHFLLLPEPFSCDVGQVLRTLRTQWPQAVPVGGLTSGAAGPGESALLLDDRVYEDGLVGVALSGNLEMLSIVAQGARPLGEPMIVTRARNNIVYELNVGLPTEALQRLYRTLSPRDQQLCHTSLLLGVERTDKRADHGMGDFLIGDVLGMDPARGAMALSREVPPYRVVQFHLRDADVATNDLRSKLHGLPEDKRRRLRGGIMFSCTGRGEGLFGEADHDTSIVSRHLGAIPMGGLFCSGEIGPVGDRSYVHGYTAVLGLFGTRY